MATNDMSRNIADAATGASEIAASVTGVALAAAAASEGVAETRSSSAELSRMSTELTDLLARFTYVAQAEDGTSGGSSVQAQISKAIGAHGMWKKRLAGAITSGAHSENIATVALDDQCEFGRWLKATVPTSRDGDHHRASVALHAGFHGEAAKVLRMVSAGQQAEARASVATGGRFSEASRLLTATMIDWRKATATTAS